jgi:hypothetical protein
MAQRRVKNLRRYTELCAGAADKGEQIAIEEGD